MSVDETLLDALPASNPPGEEALPLPPLSALPSGRTLHLMEGGRLEQPTRTPTSTSTATA
jgi:hypothetical protein